MNLLGSSVNVVLKTRAVVGDDVDPSFAGARSVVRVASPVVSMTNQGIGLCSGARLQGNVSILGNHVDVTVEIHGCPLVVAAMADLSVSPGVRPRDQVDISIGRDPDVSGKVSRGRVAPVPDLGGGVITAGAATQVDPAIDGRKLDFVSSSEAVKITEVVEPASRSHLRGGKAREEVPAAGTDANVPRVAAIRIPSATMTDEGHGTVPVAARHSEVAGGTDRDIADVRALGAAAPVADHCKGVVLGARIQGDVSSARGHGDIPLVSVDQVRIVRIVRIPSTVTEHGVTLVLITMFQGDPEVRCSRIAGVGIDTGRRRCPRIDILEEGHRRSSLDTVGDIAHMGSRRDGARSLPILKVGGDVRIRCQGAIPVRIRERSDDGPAIKADRQDHAPRNHAVVVQVEIRPVAQ